MATKQKVSKQSGETPEKVILSIDGATKTGYAIWRNGEIVKSGTKQLSRKNGKRLNEYRKWLLDTVVEWQVTNIIAEDIYREHNHLMDKTYKALSQIQGVTEMASEETHTESKFINPLTVKRYMINGTTCNRAKDKQRMINRVTALGYNLETPTADDEADAIGIMLYYLDSHDLPITHPKK